MMGRKYREQANFFYEFRLDDMIPKGHLLRRINVFVTSVLGDLHEQLGPFYSAIGRPSIDPELLIRMLIVGYCFGIRSERKLCEEVKLHLASRWFCRLDLNDAIPHHSTFSENRLNRFRERSDILRHIFERVVMAAMGMGLVKGEGFAVDASVMEANASRYHGKAPDDKGSGAAREWMIPSETWKAEICQGLDPKLVARVLAKRGMLLRAGDGFQPVRKIGGANKRVYVVNSRIFDGGGDEG